MTSALPWRRLFLVLVFLIQGTLPAFALSEKERDQLRSLPDWIPYVGCQETKALRQCFLWTTEACQLSTQNSTNSCLNLYRTDWSHPMAKNLDDWQNRIMDCVVRDTKARFKHLIVDSLICQNKGIRK